MLSSSIKLFSFCALAFWQISICSALDCPPNKKYYKNKACAATCADLSENYSINFINCNPDHLDEFCGCEDGLIFDDEGQCSSPQLATCLIPEPLPEPVVPGVEGETKGSNDKEVILEMNDEDIEKQEAEILETDKTENQIIAADEETSEEEDQVIEESVDEEQAEIVDKVEVQDKNDAEQELESFTESNKINETGSSEQQISLDVKKLVYIGLAILIVGLLAFYVRKFYSADEEN